MSRRRKTGLFLITLIICMLLFSVSAFAAGTVARIGNKTYTSLPAAVKAVKKGQTIRVTKNISGNAEIRLNKKVAYTLDFGKHTCKCPLTIQSGTVTLKNSKKQSGRILIKDNASVTILSGVYISTAKENTPAIINYGTLTVKGGTIKGGSASSAVVNSGKYVMNGGMLTSNAAKVTTYVAAEGSISTIKKGTVYSKRRCAIYCWEGFQKFTLTGGSVKCDGKEIPAVAVGETKSSKVKIKKNCIASSYKKLAYKFGVDKFL